MEKFSFILKIIFCDFNNNNNNENFNLIEINSIKYEKYDDFINFISKKLNFSRNLILKINFNNFDLDKPIEIKDNMSVSIFYNNLNSCELTQILNIYLKNEINSDEINNEIVINNENNEFSGNLCSQCENVIYGKTFKCSQCKNFYLCNKCFDNNKKKFKHQHKFFVD